VHFFWGSFRSRRDPLLGSFRAAASRRDSSPARPITREAYAQEVSSVGFWPGSAASPTPLYYSYAYPEPPGFSEAKVRPVEASYYAPLREFVLPYDAVRTAAAPDEMLLEFAQSVLRCGLAPRKMGSRRLEEAELKPPLGCRVAVARAGTQAHAIALPFEPAF
jgi:hypothetical protein